MLPPRSFADDYAWQADRLWLVKRALAELVIVEAPMEADRALGQDLLVLTRGDNRIAVRLRQERMFAKFADEITIRDERASGAPTELHKIRAGLIDFFFYGFVDASGDGLLAWVVGNLEVFNAWYAAELRVLPPGQVPGRRFRNADGGSWFQVFALGQLPAA